MISRRNSCKIQLIKKFVTIPWWAKTVKYEELTEKVTGVLIVFTTKTVHLGP